MTCGSIGQQAPTRMWCVSKANSNSDQKRAATMNNKIPFPFSSAGEWEGWGQALLPGVARLTDSTTAGTDGEATLGEADSGIGDNFSTGSEEGSEGWEKKVSRITDQAT
mmetsp:Transcript_30895/g.49993  ORF Transcript_30895/g.49993 Transcript_30895/m.49993 type:complete len:109 (-) Transcript_30895:1492-1818(-)